MNQTPANQIGPSQGAMEERLRFQEVELLFSENAFQRGNIGGLRPPFCPCSGARWTNVKANAANIASIAAQAATYRARRERKASSAAANNAAIMAPSPKLCSKAQPIVPAHVVPTKCSRILISCRYGIRRGTCVTL